MSSRKHGFTLVELLVVIGIIAVLIAILLPALNKAREAAKTVACLSNMRQLAVSFQMYTNQYDDYFPPYYQKAAAGAPSSTESWPGMMVVSGCVPDPEIFKDPSLDSVYPNFRTIGLNTKDRAANSAWSYVHYGYNIDDVGGSTRLPGSPKGPDGIPLPAKRNQIRQPTQTILLVDTLALLTVNPPADTYVRGYLYAYDQVLYAPAGKNGYTCDPRHNDGNSINVLWVDGHATTLSLDSRDKGLNPPNPWHTLTKWSPTTSNYWDRE